MPKSQNQAAVEDNDAGKGAVEQDRPEQETNVAPLEQQLDHRDQDVLNKMNDTDFPEPGQSPEHSGQLQGRNDFNSDTRMGERCLADSDKESDASRRDPDGNNPEGATQDQDPGQRQKQNQNDKKDDDLAA
jgi:hypothetical protein